VSLVARYDGELRYTDEQFGRLREALERNGRWVETLVVVVADHGEEFWDHGGFEHGHTHYRELLRVPLIVRRPDDPAGLVVTDRVRQVDIVPTVLDFAGRPLGADLPGRPLGSGSAPYAFAEGSLWGGDLFSVRSDAGTLILRRDDGAQQFFGPDDVLEREPQAAGPEALLELLRSLPELRAPGRTPVEPTPEQLEKLRSLGYAH
jgi:arylsulfatase A-like enzyme